MKANSFKELPILRSLFYKGMAKTLVEESNGWITEHYFEIKEDNESKKVYLMVNKVNEPIDELKNPEVKVDVRNISAKTKTLVLRWRRGEDFVYPVFSNQDFGDRLVTNSDLLDVYRLGISLRDIWDGNKAPEKKSNVLLLALIVFSLVISFVSLLLMLQVADKVGVVLF